MGHGNFVKALQQQTLKKSQEQQQNVIKTPNDKFLKMEEQLESAENITRRILKWLIENNIDNPILKGDVDFVTDLMKEAGTLEYIRGMLKGQQMNINLRNDIILIIEEKIKEVEEITQKILKWLLSKHIDNPNIKGDMDFVNELMEQTGILKNVKETITGQKESDTEPFME